MLSDLDVEVVEPARAFDSTSQAGRGWLPDVDFVCAIFPAEDGWETPAAMYLEIGQAVGADLPILLVAEPPRRLDPALFSLPVARVSATNKAALASQINLFLRSVGRPSASMATSRHVDAAELSFIREELAGLREAFSLTGGGGTAQASGMRLEQIALRLLRAAGAEAQETTGTDGIGDIAAWVPGTEKFIPGPLLVEVKIVRRPQIDRAVLDQLQLYALTRDAQWSILLYYRRDRDLKVQVPKGGTWPMVMVFDIEELASNLRQQTLAQVLNNERNSLVHGLGR
ncbi:hypothetical protein ABZ738_31440 [Micromonospora sp. NPDC047793]|uniref:hypothetical protein n=1 Tax=Micromonospora sp. NPDC047793 TaxID=3154342 RepID=UPI0033D0D088